MEGVEPERRRKQKINVWQGAVIGVATVAGLGLVRKLLSFLRRDEKPKKIGDADIASLEAVLSGDAAKSALPPQTAKMHESANLQNDKLSHFNGVNGHGVSSPSSDSVFVVAKDDITGDDEVHASQDSVGDSLDVADITNILTAEDSVLSPVHQVEANRKDMLHLNGKGVGGHEDVVDLPLENEGNHEDGDAAELHNGGEWKVNSDDAVTELHDEKADVEHDEQLPGEDTEAVHGGSGGKPHIEDAVELHAED